MHDVQLQGCHVFSKRYRNTRYVVTNLFTGCAACHRWWHDNPVLAARWWWEWRYALWALDLAFWHPDHLRELLVACKEITTRPDWNEVKAGLEQRMASSSPEGRPAVEIV